MVWVYTDLVLNNPDGYTQMQAQGLYTASLIGRNLAYMTEDTNSEFLQNCEEVWTSNKVPGGKLSDDVSLSTEDAAAFNALWGDIATYIQETTSKFIVGDLNTAEDFDAFLDNLHTMGIDQCLTYWQAAYDEYSAR